MEDAGGFRLYDCLIDGTCSKTKSGGDGIGSTRVGKGIKIMILVDAGSACGRVQRPPISPKTSHPAALWSHEFRRQRRHESSVTKPRIATVSISSWASR